MVMTYGELYLNAKAKLSQQGIEEAQLDAREIVAAAAGKSKDELFRDKMMYAPQLTIERTVEMLKRRMSGEPVAYVIGEWEFYGLTFKLNKHTLIPRQDTEVLAERAIEILSSQNGESRALDLCCGSGCIGITLAKNCPHSRVVLGDVTEDVLRVARYNVRLHGLGGRVSCMRLNALESAPPMVGVFDVICSNPPYIPTRDILELDSSVRDYEPSLALDGGADGLDFYRTIGENYFPVLRRGGTLLYEIGIGQSASVASLLRSQGYINIEIIKDTAGIDRVVTAQKF